MTARKKDSPPSRPSTLVHLFAGGLGGTAGVFVTSPLDIVQTRLQSSIIKCRSSAAIANIGVANIGTVSAVNVNVPRIFNGGVFSYIRHIAKTEGLTALYKGLGPNLAGVAPSRAIYFAVYSNAKEFYTNASSFRNCPPALVYMGSALTASICTSTCTNPIWFVKTRLQLDFRATGVKQKILHLIRDVYKREGIPGFYGGLSASYFGASETMIYFVIYEELKKSLAKHYGLAKDSALPSSYYILSAGIAKLLASVAAYPHEVVRTRLRQPVFDENGLKVYSGFFQTLLKVYRDEGRVGLYGGLWAHLLRQVPNTAIMFLVYEGIVNFFD